LTGGGLSRIKAPVGKPLPRKLRILIPVLLLGLVAAGVWQWRLRQAAPADTLILSGTVEARQVRPAFMVPGRIRVLHVDEGMAVKQGQLLAELDDQDYRLALQQAASRRDAAAAAQAALAEAQARLAYTVMEVKRLQKLVPKGLASQELLDRARMEREAARAARDRANQTLRLLQIGPRQEDIAQARAELGAATSALREAQRRLDYTKLYAPVDGVVSVRLAEAGNVIGLGTPVFEIDALAQPWIRAWLNEPDLPRVKLGQPVTIRADGLDTPLTGTLAFISPRAEFTPKTVETRAEFTPKTVETRALRVDLVYRIKVNVANPEGRLKLGMPVDLILATR